MRVPPAEARSAVRTWWRRRGGHVCVPSANARCTLRTWCRIAGSATGTRAGRRPKGGVAATAADTAAAGRQPAAAARRTRSPSQCVLRICPLSAGAAHRRCAAGNRRGARPPRPRRPALLGEILCRLAIEPFARAAVFVKGRPLNGRLVYMCRLHCSL